MRIAIIIEAFPSLSETFISNKVEQLCLRGHQVFVFCNRINEELFKELFKEQVNIKVVSFHKKNIVPYLFLHARSVIQCLKGDGKFQQNIFRRFRIDYINKFSPDIIHFGFSGVALSYLNDIDQLKGKKVVSCRGTAENVNLLLSKQRQANLEKVFDKVDAIHCVSSALKKTVSPYCRQPEKLFVNNPSIDTLTFQRETPYTDQSSFIILSVGRFIFQKGYLIGLLAMKKLKEYTHNFKWIIAGSGGQMDELMFYIHQMNLEKHVLLVGNKNRDEIIALYNEASVFFLPSVTEGIANVALEAMSMELPVVSTRCGGMEEAITHGVNGLLADVYDHISLAKNLVELLKNCELRILLGKAARRKVIEKFDLGIQINKFESVYNQLVNSTPLKTTITSGKETNSAQVMYRYRSDNPRRYLQIGIIVPQFPSYTETFFINKIIGLCERGHQVIVFCNVHNHDPLLKETYNLDNYPNLKIVALDFNKLSDVFFSTIFLNPFILLRNLSTGKKKFKSKLYYSLCEYNFKKYKCDVYHFGYSGLAAAYLPVLKTLPGKIVVSCLGTAENVKPITEEGRIEKLRSLFNNVDRIHCVSQKMAETIKQYGANCEKIFVNHPAADTKIFSRKKEYIANEQIKILSVGRLVFQKGFLMGILAVAELKKKFENFYWAIIGEGPEKEQLLFHINALGLNDQVQLVGKKIRNEIIHFYEESDIFFLPSVSEGLANVVLEAMAMKLPVVSSINGGIEEVISNGENGILCENYDVISMAQQLFELCINFEKRKQLGLCARKTIEKNFDIKRYIDVYEEEYYRLAQ